MKDLLKKHSYNKEETILIGDSINDLEAAEENSISFIGYKNKKLQALITHYVAKFCEF